MASLQRDPSGTFHICFRYGGLRFKRSLKTTDQRKASAASVRVAENIRLAENGRLVLPDDADIPTFLLSDGKVTSQPRKLSTITLGELFEVYQERIPAGALEPSTLKSAGVHMRHFVRLIGPKKTLRSLTNSELQEYITIRSKEKGKRGNVSGTTIRKELATLGSLWNWAISQELVEKPFPRRGLVFPKRDDKPPFQTWQQIEHQIKRGQMTVEQADPLWDCLYLNTTELDELLAHIEKSSGYSFLYPMSLLAAHTGMRRSELCRSRDTDIDLQAGTILVQERKRNKSSRTSRLLPISKRLKVVLAEWLDTKPASPFTFPEDHRYCRQRKVQDDEGCVAPDEATHHLSMVLANTKWKNIRGWHIFRHSFISNCATKGIDQRFIDTWVGHQTDEQRRRYRHLFPDSQKKALDSVFT
ncbi:MAG: tyrosine-type recombinase/integrase [Pirellulaceae bacterium]|nr:tyrosine-type recombinase/integrase [Pirellulaceae bacterium]